MKKSVFNLLFMILCIVLWVLNPWPFEQSLNSSKTDSIEKVTMVRGGFDPRKRKTESKIPKKILRKYFPDWSVRVEYQNRQLEFLQSAKKKLREADRLRFSEDSKSKLLTEDEKDALNYFGGTGFYKYHQDLNTPPNRFDTRETFLNKMQDSEMRNNFLKAYNRRINNR